MPLWPRARIAWRVDILVSYLAEDHADPRVALCHGVFDMIHAGHIRYFEAAKDGMELLVVGLTPDRFVSERQRVPNAPISTHPRPIVPEYWRAVAVAALRIVDYVVIDDAPHPASLIRRVRPARFCKGAEYQAEPTPAILEAKAAVEAVGGQMFYTPGDVVFSVSALLQ